MANNIDDSSNDSDILSVLENERINLHNQQSSIEDKLVKLTNKFKKACNQIQKLTNKIRVLDDLKPKVTSPPLFDSLDEHENTRLREKYNNDCRNRDHLNREIESLNAVKNAYISYCKKTANEITCAQCELYGQSVVLQAYQQQAQDNQVPFVPPQALVNYQQEGNQQQQQNGDPTEQINLNNLNINQNNNLVTYSEQELIFA